MSLSDSAETLVDIQTMVTDPEHHENQYVTFTLDNEEYGLPILQVQEIIGYKKLTKIPNVPDYIKGIFNLRGTIVPSVDMRTKFGMEKKDFDQFTVVMIVVVQERTIGMIVDSVADVVIFSDVQMQKTPRVTARIRTEFIKGIGQTNDKFVVLLDADRLLSTDELNIIDGNESSALIRN